MKMQKAIREMKMQNPAIRQGSKKNKHSDFLQ